jgi:cytochrome P450
MSLLLTLFIIPILLVLAILIPPLTHRLKLHFASNRHFCSSPPLRPSSDPFFGLDILLTNLSQLKTHCRVKQLHASFAKLGATYGFYLFGRRTIITSDARNVQFVLTTQYEKFGVGPGRLRGSWPMVGQGVINLDGGAWRRGRDLILPVFARGQIADREMFEKHVKKFLERMEGGGEMVDLKGVFDELVSVFGGSRRVFVIADCEV